MELTDKVSLNNLCGWPLYFRRANGLGDVRVPANAKNFAAIDVAEVQMQIQLNNPLFTGTGEGRQGDHARLFIVDDEQRKALLGYDDGADDDATVLIAKNVKELLAINNKNKFQARLEELVKTDAEKKMVQQLAKESGGDEVAAWKIAAINEIAETATI